MPTERAPLNRARIARAALELIDAEGLEKLTMRRLAGRLDVEAMSLYHHVGDKSDLLVAVADVVLDEIAGSTDPDWRTRVIEVLAQFRAACLAHPGAVPLVVATGFTTPSALMPIDTMLGGLAQAGLDQEHQVRCFRLLLSFALGSISCELAEMGGHTGEGSATPLVPDVDAGAQLPHLAAVADLLGGCDYDADFAEGLHQLLAAAVAGAPSER
ncbi:MAG: TetR/AcrR family transcriptional regulator C-terminal domain-containing protein [Actinomycetota bacterium]|nr:TetR/AcrR family transcriptional regulator C-terminal domain-containing protein [Actinomycetota bacterium]